MEKAKVSKKQAETIEFILERVPEHALANLIRLHVQYPNDWEDYAGINGMDLDLLIKALYFGFEIVLTPEEAITEYYKELSSVLEESIANHDIDKEAKIGMMIGALKRTLTLTGMEIEGVNK